MRKRAFPAWTLVFLIIFPKQVNAGVTVITHGFQLSLGTVEKVCWPLWMGLAISERNSNIPVFIIGGQTKYTGTNIIRNIIEEDSTKCSSETHFEPKNTHKYPNFFIDSLKASFGSAADSTTISDAVVVFDWAQKSDANFEGYSEAAGDALSAYLIAGAKEKLWDLKELHFIGHSRGAVVNSEAIQRLIYLAGDKQKLLPADVMVDNSIHMTTLDPHPAGNWLGVGEHMNDNKVNGFNEFVECGDRAFPSKRCGVVGWKYGSSHAVSQIDNYFRKSTFIIGPGLVIGLDRYKGLKQPVELTNFDLKNCGGHSAPWKFYIDTIASSKDNLCLTIPTSMVGYNLLSARSPNLNERILDVLMDVREDKEFNYSKNSVDQNYLFNGNFSKTGNAAGWGMFGGYNGGKQDANILFEKARLNVNDTKLVHSITYLPHANLDLSFDVNSDKKTGFLDVLLKPVRRASSNSDLDHRIIIKTIDFKSYEKKQILKLPFSGDAYYLGFEVRRGLYNEWPDVSIDNIRISKESHIVNDNQPLPQSMFSNELAIVLDQSGSMSEYSLDTGKTKIEKAKESVIAIVAEGVEGSGVSLSSFSDNGLLIQAMVPNKEFQSSQQEILGRIQPTGATNIGAGLEMGYQELDKTASNVPKAASLLSDGQNNRGEYESVVEKFKAKGWSIYTTAFGADADETALGQIAFDTNGIPRTADINNLTSVQYANVNHRQSRNEVATINDLLPPDGQLTYPFQVSENTNDIKIQTSWLGSQLRTQLISPNGSQYTDAAVSEINGHYIEGDTFQSMTIPTPKAGNWSLLLDWSEPPNVTEQVNVNISEKTDLAVSVFGMKPSYSMNERVNILVDIDDVSSGKRVAVDSAVINAEVLKPEPRFIEILSAKTTRWEVYDEAERDISRSVKLFDDGEHGDNKEGDGIYGGYFQETNLNGPYMVLLDISGVMSDGSDFSQQTTTIFQVGDIQNNSITTSRWLSIKQQSGNDDLLKEDIFKEPLDTIDDLMKDQEDSLDNLLN